MRNTFLTLALVTCIVAFTCIFSGCKDKNGPSAKANFDKEASYALGMDVGESMKRDGIYLDIKEFTQGLTDSMYGSKTRYTQEEYFEILGDAFTAFEASREAESRKSENEFLEENGKKPGIIVTDSGLQYEVLTKGDGPSPSYESVVQVHYEGTLIDGTVFDSSYSRGEPAEFPLSGVISGWTEGLQLMNVGSRYRFFIPSDLGYGSRGQGSIPPYSTLVFEVELIEVNDDDNAQSLGEKPEGFF